MKNIPQYGGELVTELSYVLVKAHTCYSQVQCKLTESFV